MGRNLAPPDRGKIEDGIFEADRIKLLRFWSTGSAIDHKAVFDLHHNLAKRKSAAVAFTQAGDAGETLMLAGVATSTRDEHVQDLLSLWESGTQLHTTVADRFTCNSRFAEAEAASNRDADAEGPKLNGLPIVTLGLAKARSIVAKTPMPNQLDASGIDPRLASEIALAAGYTSIRGGVIDALERVSDSPTTARAIAAWRYIDRLVGVLGDAGVTIHREVPGARAVPILPPGIRCALLVLDALAAAEQGVRHLSLAVGTNLHIVQDVVALQVAQRLTRKYLDRSGASGTAVTVVLDTWSGRLPEDLSDAYAILSVTGFTSVMAGAQGIALRQTGGQSATGVRAAAAWVRMLRAGVTIACGQRLPPGAELALEAQFAERECCAIVDRVLSLGEGRVHPGVVRALDSRELDIPGGSLAGRPASALPVRDITGAVRYLNTGRLPFDSDIRDFHAERVRQRTQAEGTDTGVGLMLKDLKFDDMEMFA